MLMDSTDKVVGYAGVQYGVVVICGYIHRILLGDHEGIAAPRFAGLAMTVESLRLAEECKTCI